MTSRSLDEPGLWGDLDAATKEKIIGAMRRRRVGRGETLVERGAPSETLYIVQFGQFGVIGMIGSLTGEVVAEIGKDQLIGEMGFFTGDPRGATVVALRDSEILEIDRPAYDRLAEAYPEVSRVVMRALAKRLARLAAFANQGMVQNRRIGVIVLVQAGGAPPPPGFVAALTRALGAFAAVAVLDSDAAAARFGADGHGFADWLGEVESAHDLVLCIADPELTPWTKAALHGADELLLVASGGPATFNPVEAYALDLFPAKRRRLATVAPTRPPDCPPVASWLRGRETFMIHRLALDAPADFHALARFLTGQAIGFVAGAGGALGMAHIGVFKAFAEHGVVFDMFGGSSTGSGVAATFARLKTPEQLEADIHEIFVRNAAMKKFASPRLGLLDHTILEATLTANSKGEAIEDLWRPFFAVATDLSIYMSRVIRRGAVWQAVRASCAIPGVLPPFFDEDGHMLVDGAVSDNVPIAPMRALKSGPNLILDLRAGDHRMNDLDARDMPGRGKLLRSLTEPPRGDPEFPSPASVIQQSIFSSFGERARPRAATDLLMHPSVCRGASFMSWDMHGEMIEHAYRQALLQLDALEAKGDPALAAMKRLSRPNYSAAAAARNSAR
jgi:NTE family protein